MQSSSPPSESLPYVVLRGASGNPTYKRRIPAELKPVLGSSTITVRLEGHPYGSLAQRRQFLGSYSRVHQEAEQRLTKARGQLRELSAIEQLGVAGAWAKRAGPQGTDTVHADEAAAILAALSQLELVVPALVPLDWRMPAETSPRALVPVVQELAGRLECLDHPGLAPVPAGHLAWGEEDVSAAAARSYLEGCVRGTAALLSGWLGQAQQQLDALGLVVAPEQRQQVALRMARTAAALGRQEAAIEAGRPVQPLVFPEPPKAAVLLSDALSRWKALRDPAPKTVLDAERRIGELEAFVGHDRLDALSPEQVSEWRAQLIASTTTSTVKRKLALVRAVLQAAAADGLPIEAQVLERMSAKGLRESGGTRQQRRPFTLEEAALLWEVSRQQQGPRPLDRWAFPLGLALGCRLEELAGLRRGDVRLIDNVWVVEIQPTEDRRLKNDSSARRVPIPGALQSEGFISWVQQQGEGLLFPEPEPPAADPRRSHYASIRLGKVIRRDAQISDPTAVFHSCRHFTAQGLVDAGAEQRVIEQLLGHSSKSMTARYSRGGIPLSQLAGAMEGRDWSWIPPIENKLQLVD